MVEQDSAYKGIAISGAGEKAEPKYPWMREWWFRLLAVLFLAELFTPFLQWPFGLPKMVELSLHGTFGLILAATFIIMLTEDRIPKSILVLLGISLIWGIVALDEGQSIPAFVWGWYRMFRYPLIGIFTYLAIDNPKDFAKWFFKFCVALLAFQVGVQIVMYAMGFPISDEMGGTFGWRGVAKYIMMVFIIVSMAIGHWLATRDLKYLVVSLALGLVGSILSATKFYLIGVVLMLGVAGLIQMVWGGKFRQLLTFLLIILLIGAVFLPIYNNFLVNELGLPTLQETLQGDVLEEYLFFSELTEVGVYDIGRGQSAIYGWQQIQRDEITTLFGFGLGTRSSSALLGIGGASFQNDLYGGAPSTSLSAWLQEYGLVGLVVFLIIIVWINMQLFRFARRFTDPYQLSLVYGLIIFTSCWPVWLFYIDVTAAGVLLILYCVSLGYIFRQAHDQPRHPVQRSRGEPRQFVRTENSKRNSPKPLV